MIQGVIRVSNAIDEARRSPGAADFERLRLELREEALGPASRLAVRNAMRLEEDILMWLRVQELMTLHLRELSDTVGESLRSAQRE